jgi:hypothetical protein
VRAFAKDQGVLMKSVRRAKNQARIVITLEVEVPPPMMAEAPNWQTDALDILRPLMAEFDEGWGISSIHQWDAQLIPEFLNAVGITILSEKYEVAK